MHDHIRKPAILIPGANGEMGHGLITRLAEAGKYHLIALDVRPLDAELQHYCSASIVGDILETRLLERVQSLKNFARDDRGGLKKPLDINEVVDAALTIIQPTIKKSTDNFHAQFGRELPQIHGNLQQLEQVVINLITNSCQALPHKAARLELETAYEAGHKSVIVRVNDEGIGIAEPDLKHIFDPFFTTKRDTGGTGLDSSVASCLPAGTKLNSRTCFITDSFHLVVDGRAH